MDGVNENQSKREIMQGGEASCRVKLCSPKIYKSFVLSNQHSHVIFAASVSKLCNFELNNFFFSNFLQKKNVPYKSSNFTTKIKNLNLFGNEFVKSSFFRKPIVSKYLSLNHSNFSVFIRKLLRNSEYIRKS